MKYTQAIIASALVALPLLAPPPASAGMLLPGTNCMPITMTQAPDIYFSKDGVTNKGSRDLWVTCPVVAASGELVGSPFGAAGFSPTAGISCILRDVTLNTTWVQGGFTISNPALGIGYVGESPFDPLFGLNMSIACKLPPGKTLTGLYFG